MIGVLHAWIDMNLIVLVFFKHTKNAMIWFFWINTTSCIFEIIATLMVHTFHFTIVGIQFFSYLTYAYTDAFSALVIRTLHVEFWIVLNIKLYWLLSIIIVKTMLLIKVKVCMTCRWQINNHWNLIYMNYV